jgi:predicted alpha-1,6-mannanase (GH76 family)
MSMSEAVRLLTPFRRLGAAATVLALVISSLTSVVMLFPGNAQAASTSSAAAAKGMATMMGAYDTAGGVIGLDGWWNAAVGLSTMETYQQVTGDTQYSYAIAGAWDKNHQNNFETDALDDTLWWALAMAQAYDITGNLNYLQTAEAAAAYVHGYWDSTCGGGVWWSTAKTYKNAITNELFLQIAATLHNRVVGDTVYLAWANAEWNWFKGSGMINGNHLVNDGLTTACANNGQTPWTYNQGVILAGLAELYRATNDASLTATAQSIADAATGSLTVNGILVEPCEPSCGPDAPSFKGIFVSDLRAFASVAKTTRYDAFIHAQAASIIAHDMNAGGQMDLMWAGPVTNPTTKTQASAEAALVADLGAPPLSGPPVAPPPASAAGPCEIYGANGTPCVGAHSTTRALYSTYAGPLYQVQRSSDGAKTDVGLLTTGGYANAAAQDAFCVRTNCIITVVYDQSPQHNQLGIEGPGSTGGQDVGANASVLPVTAGGHKVYGIYIAGNTGYRDNTATGLAVNGQAEGMYMVASGTHVNAGCCFDYGNVETNTADTGNGHMDTVNLTTFCGFAPCTGAGPWVEADLENGQYLGGNGNNPANLGNSSNFVTALLKNNGQTTYALKGGNSTTGGLSTWWEGALPNRGGYLPMHQEGAIVLGTGGDNSNWSVGSFFEGVITKGYPTTAADNAVQANIVSVGYGGPSNGNGPTAGTITGPGGQCVDVGGDDVGVDLAPVQLWNCQSNAVDQHWTQNSDQSISTLGRCLDIEHNGTANGNVVELWDCNGVGGQKWVQQADGSLRNPQSGRCLDSPGGNTANGTRLEIWDCNGSAAQKFFASGGAPISGPGGKCVDVGGDDIGGNGAAVQLWDCQSYAADQHWSSSPDGSARTLGRCLDVVSGGTSNGTLVELWDCNGTGNQKWTQRPDGSLSNPQSGRCLDAPNGSSANGVRLQIWDCNGSAAQKFAR